MLSFWRERNKKITNTPIFLVIVARPLMLLPEIVDYWIGRSVGLTLDLTATDFCPALFLQRVKDEPPLTIS